MHIRKIDDQKYAVVDGVGCVVGHITKVQYHDETQWGFVALDGFEPPMEEMPFILEQLQILNEVQNVEAN